MISDFQIWALFSTSTSWSWNETGKVGSLCCCIVDRVGETLWQTYKVYNPDHYSSTCRDVKDSIVFSNGSTKCTFSICFCSLHSAGDRPAVAWIPIAINPFGDSADSFKVPKWSIAPTKSYNILLCVEDTRAIRLNTSYKKKEWSSYC